MVCLCSKPVYHHNRTLTYKMVLIFYTLHTRHNCSFLAIGGGLCHLPVSILRWWLDRRNLVNAFLYNAFETVPNTWLTTTLGLHLLYINLSRALLKHAYKYFDISHTLAAPSIRHSHIKQQILYQRWSVTSTI